MGPEVDKVILPRLIGPEHALIHLVVYLVMPILDIRARGLLNHHGVLDALELRFVAVGAPHHVLLVLDARLGVVSVQIEVVEAVVFVQLLVGLVGVLVVVVLPDPLFGAFSVEVVMVMVDVGVGVVRGLLWASFLKD